MTRAVRLVIVDADRVVLGELPRFEVASPWWSDVRPVVREAKARFGTEMMFSASSTWWAASPLSPVAATSPTRRNSFAGTPLPCS